MTIIPVPVEEHSSVTADDLAAIAAYKRARSYLAVIREAQMHRENAERALSVPSIARGKEAHLEEAIARAKATEKGAWAALYAALGFPTIPTPTDS